MPRAWRIVKEKYAATAFDGEGARQYGGRWNSKGVRVIYASESLALAALETLVHINRNPPLLYLTYQITFAAKLVQQVTLHDLPEGWDSEPPGPVSKSIGDEWIQGARTPVLQVPSAITRVEASYLFNPDHKDFKKLKIGAHESFAFDPRLIHHAFGA